MLTSPTSPNLSSRSRMSLGLVSLSIKPIRSFDISGLLSTMVAGSVTRRLNACLLGSLTAGRLLIVIVNPPFLPSLNAYPTFRHVSSNAASLTVISGELRDKTCTVCAELSTTSFPRERHRFACDWMHNYNRFFRLKKFCNHLSRIRDEPKWLGREVKFVIVPFCFIRSCNY